MTITASAAWAALSAHRQSFANSPAAHLRRLFADDPRRAQAFTLAFDDILFDFSKQRVTRETLGLLVALAEEAGVAGLRARMFAGEHINASEDRAVLHVALRCDAGPFPRRDFDVMPEVLETRARMAALADRLRSGQCRGYTGLPIKDVVNIGIGGSDLGPKMMQQALRAISHPRLGLHFISNLDAGQLAPLLQTLDPRTTLFILVSKTFTTQETLVNAETARVWLLATLGDTRAIADHFVAVSARPERAVQFGIAEKSVFPIWDWVGGRYSLWSAVGLALMIAIGPQAFNEMLRGAQRMDEHFCSAPFAANLPVLMALIGVWNTNFLGASTNAVLPYNESLKYLPAFLQQLEMESNGKSARGDGGAPGCETSPIVWGELGNNGQHAFFQLLHQGGRIVPCDFIAAVNADFPLPNHQEALLANCFAQSAALAFGKNEDEVRAALEQSGMPADEIAVALPQRLFAGNQPSSTLLLARLSPSTLGSLIALYEHKVFVQGAIWGINSFDQWGVELGKAVAARILPAMSDPRLIGGFDSSTQGLLSFCQRHFR